jgi:CrcB protein
MDTARKGYAILGKQFRKARVKAYLLIAIGSGLGGMARHWLSTVVAARVAGPFPWGVFFVNVLGSALIGYVLASPESRMNPATRQFLVVGILGGFTTFSAFSAQTLSLLQGGKVAIACTYAIMSVLVCVLGCWGGWLLGQAR